MSYLQGLRAEITTVRDEGPGLFDPKVEVQILDLPAEIKKTKNASQLLGTVLVPETMEQMHQRMGNLPYKGIGTTLVQEIRLMKVVSPQHRRKPWRWGITDYWTAQSTNDGVYDARIHLRDHGGFARTRGGALRAIGKNLAG